MPAGTGTSGNYSSFILRLWVEPNAEGWRWGLIQHVATRKKRRFSTAAEMLDFIAEYAAVGETSIPFSLDGGLSDVADPADDSEIETAPDYAPDGEKDDMETGQPKC